MYEIKPTDNKLRDNFQYGKESKTIMSYRARVCYKKKMKKMNM